MKMIFSLLFSLPFLFSEPSTTMLHDFHLSRTRIEYDAQEQEWQVSLHIFIDDLALALEEKGVPPLQLGTASESPEADAYLKKYLRRTLAFEAGGEQLEWQWLGKETSEDLSAFHVYFFLPQANASLPLKVKNQLMIELYDDQQNMLQFVGPAGQTRQLLFHKDYWQEELNTKD